MYKDSKGDLIDKEDILFIINIGKIETILTQNSFCDFVVENGDLKINTMIYSKCLTIEKAESWLERQ